jgi:hypothetical protein
MNRYPEVQPGKTWEACDAVLLPNEPYPFGAREAEEVQRAGGRPLLVDGEAFSWYGSRMWHVHACLGQGGSREGAPKAGM